MSEVVIANDLSSSYSGHVIYTIVTSPNFSATESPDWSEFKLTLTTYGETSHTHTITYGIYEETLTSPSLVVTAGTEGAESAVGTYATDQTNVDVTPFIPSTTNSWYVVKFTPNKNMRIEANVYVQMFIQSR